MESQITNNIKIILAPSFFSKDITLLELFNKNKNSNITKEIFIQNIIDGLVYITLMDDDPIGYAIINGNGGICEYYVEDIQEKEDVKRLLQNLPPQRPLSPGRSLHIKKGATFDSRIF